MSLLRDIARSAIVGALVGLPILGICGRGIMRIIAHWEGRVPMFTLGGSLTVVFAGTMAGLAGGIAHGALAHYIRNAMIRNTIFVVLCIAFTWRAVNELLPRPRLMFVALTIVYAIVLEVIAKMRARPESSSWSSPQSSQVA